MRADRTIMLRHPCGPAGVLVDEGRQARGVGVWLRCGAVQVPVSVRRGRVLPATREETGSPRNLGLAIRAQDRPRIRPQRARHLRGSGQKTRWPAGTGRPGPPALGRGARGPARPHGSTGETAAEAGPAPSAGGDGIDRQPIRCRCTDAARRHRMALCGPSIGGRWIGRPPRGCALREECRGGGSNPRPRRWSTTALSSAWPSS